ncbi:MAG: CPBP family intramembrane metalloprotease [Butyrivibrio sp.]|uniref:CPBP family intramembrane glutamic endopeptidase n=1 Tax=Butyrivibrio sp. TaxID=28121 RepID=UPI0025C1A139|nr:CPBP family intramembrane glutamic endopeptidase [Butyrivibrio sp.]MBQ6589429.1 CPBP family intramembrane metalloprotease [Butyrivibrio sp.]
MSHNKAINLYLVGALGQIILVCLLVFVLRRSGVAVDYTTPLGMLAIAVGGISSALWGAVVSIKYKKIKLTQILRDFFNVAQKPRSYLLAFLFLFLDFFSLLFGGGLNISIWYAPVILFFRALLFGGIEEIGWRYFFQPALQERWDFVLATLCTFVSWAIWHFAYFYVEGTMDVVDPIPFLIGLLINCFILSSIFNVTGSLWLCAMTHALINVFSQLAVGGNAYVSYGCRVLIIVIAIVLVKRNWNNTSLKRSKSNVVSN